MTQLVIKSVIQHDDQLNVSMQYCMKKRGPGHTGQDTCQQLWGNREATTGHEGKMYIPRPVGKWLLEGHRYAVQRYAVWQTLQTVKSVTN